MSRKISHKLGIIVPYRNRYRQLLYFKKAIAEYFKDLHIRYEVIVVEQDDATAFNRAKLLNIGFVEAENLGCDYVVFHDVDMLPVDVDYTYRNVPTHLATNFLAGDKEFGLHFDQYFGGVTMFPVELFRQINGYSNEYWGWGFEDDDLFKRVQDHNLPTDTAVVKRSFGSTASLNFNGLTAYCAIPNKINFSRDWSISTTFTSDQLDLNPDLDFDKNPIFTIPGYDFTLYYSSFNRYCVEIFDKRRNIHTINSEIANLNTCNVTITWNNTLKLLKVYLNGEILQTLEIDKGVYNYTKETSIFLGSGAPTEESIYPVYYYKGKIEYFATFNNVLGDKEVYELYNTQGLGLTIDFGDYKSSGYLLSYHDAKFVKYYKLVDLVDFSENGDLFDVQVVPNPLIAFNEITIPFRNPSTFRLLDHKPGGYQDGRWQDKLTRYNQLRYINEVKPGYRKAEDDGLNTLVFHVHSRSNHKNDTHLVVGI